MTGALLLFACGALAAAQGADRVQLVDGTQVMGQVSAATLDAVTVKTAGGEQKLEGKQVLAVEFGDRPEALRAAEAFLAGLDFQNAASGFAAAAEAGGAWWVAAQAALGRADTLLAWASLDPSRAGEAADAYAKWLAANPGSLWEPRARLGQAQALAATGKTEDASRLFEELATLAFQRNLGKHVELGARLERALVYLRAGQAQVAEQRLNDLIPELQQTLAAGPPKGLLPALHALRARSEIALGDAKVARSGEAAARPYWESLLNDERATLEVRGAALVGLARALRSEGKHREAQLLLARAVATAPAGETYARALFEMGDVCRELGNTPVAGAQYFRWVQEQYPHSPWAAKARVELGG